MSREHVNELKKATEGKDADRVRWQLEIYDHIRRLKQKVHRAKSHSKNPLETKQNPSLVKMCKK